MSNLVAVVASISVSSTTVITKGYQYVLLLAILMNSSLGYNEVVVYAVESHNVERTSSIQAQGYKK